MNLKTLPPIGRAVGSGKIKGNEGEECEWTAIGTLTGHLYIVERGRGCSNVRELAPNLTRLNFGHLPKVGGHDPVQKVKGNSFCHETHGL